MTKKPLASVLSILFLSGATIGLVACGPDATSSSLTGDSSSSETTGGSSSTGASSSSEGSSSSGDSESSSSDTGSSSSDTGSSSSDTGSSSSDTGSSSSDTGSSSSDTGSSSTDPVASFTVTFNANGHGSAPAAQVLESGSLVTKPADLVASGWDFGGWFKESGCTNEWIFISDTVTGDITLYAKWTEVVNNVTSIEVDATSTHKTSFPKGVDFTSAGLVVKAKYNDETAGILDASKYTIDSSAFDKTTLADYTIIIKLVADTSITASYTVTVTSAVIDEIRVKSGTSPFTDFVLNETFYTGSIVVEGHYSDGTWTDLDEKDYTVDSSLFNNTKTGQYTITIKAVADASITYSYSASVSDLPYAGEYFSRQSDSEGNELDVAFYVMKIDAEGKYHYHYSTGYEETGTEMTMSRDADMKIHLSRSGFDYVYDDVNQTLTRSNKEGDTSVYYRYDATKYVTLLAYYGENCLDVVIAKGGSISQATFDYVTTIGFNIYSVETGGEENQVSTTDVFNADATIYLLVPTHDYSACPFVGDFYEESTGRIEITLTSTGLAEGRSGSSMPYTFKSNTGDSYLLTYMGIEFTFDSTTLLLTSSTGSVSTLKQRDPETEVIVTLNLSEELADNSAAKSLKGKYVIAKNEAIPLVVGSSGDYYQLTLDGYSEGTAITADCSYTLTGVVVCEIKILEDNPYGRFKDGYFVLNENKTITYKKSYGDPVTVSYMVTAVSKNDITIKAAIGSDVITITYKQDCITIDDGIYAGSYERHTLFVDMPFVGTFTSRDGSNASINEDGSAGIYNASSEESGNLELLSCVDDLYTFNFVIDSGENTGLAKTLTVDMKTKVLTYNEKTYAGPTYMGEAFVGVFVYRGVQVTIYDGGNYSVSTGSEGNINDVETDAEGNIELRENAGDENPVAVYDPVLDVLSFNSQNYSRAVRVSGNSLSYNYLDATFNGSDGSSATFDRYGFVWISEKNNSDNSSCVGQISVSEETVTFLEYAGGTTMNLAIADDVVSFTYGGVTYSSDLPKSRGYAFVGLNYTNLENDSSLEIYSGDYVSYNSYSASERSFSGTIKSLVEAEGIVTIVVAVDGQDDKTITYDIAADSFTYNGEVLTIDGK